ncbi:MAG: ATP-binding cassette domain-containing protein [Alphaproteobacteria bacterium]|nr:ATP-binding cassette domain-containing protein [Alphaproteobacteria bacterium]
MSARTETQPILEVKDITVTFGGLKAVDRASLSLYDNELLGFIGPNGAGKTTLMRAIIGMITPVSGHIILAGQDISRCRIVERINLGMALAQQIIKPLKDMTLLDNVALAAGGDKLLSPVKAILNRSRQQQQEVANSLLREVGLAHSVHKYPTELPLGYLKRLEVARALARQPKVLLLDEPLAGLSKTEAEGMANLIMSLPRKGRSVILIEHNLAQVRRICKTLYVQHNGCHLAFGETEDVLANRDVQLAYLGKSE